MNDRKQHYKRFFALVALFGLITSTVVYASESENSPFQPIPEPTPINKILPDLPELVTPEDPEIHPKEGLEEVPELEEPEEPEDEPETDEPTNGISENEPSENGISDNNTETSEPEENIPGSLGGVEGSAGNAPVVYVPDNVNADNYYKTAVSLDLVKIEQLSSISQDLVSINEVLKKHEKTQKDLASELSGTCRDVKTYQKNVLECLLSIAYSLSGNKIKVSADEISVSLNSAMIEDIIKTLSENETISENEPEQDPDPEIVSDDDIEDISENVCSISKGDLDQLHKDNDQLHEDLKSLFYVGIFGVIFLAMIAAGNLEQIIFKRLRG